MSAIEKGDNLKSRRYRNRRLGDFLKELDLTEGRSTGITTVQMQKNGSPRVTIETNEERNFINVFIPIHEGCEETVVLNGTQDGTQDELDNWIEQQIRKNNHITTEELAMMCGKGVRTIKRRISKLKHIKYVGSGYSGHWEIIGVNK